MDSLLLIRRLTKDVEAWVYRSSKTIKSKFITWTYLPVFNLLCHHFLLAVVTLSLRCFVQETVLHATNSRYLNTLLWGSCLFRYQTLCGMEGMKSS